MAWARPAQHMLSFAPVQLPDFTYMSQFSTMHPRPDHCSRTDTRSARLQLTSLLLALLCSSAVCAGDDLAATDAAPPYELQRFDWEGEPKPGTRLLLENRWGNINLRQSGGKGVLLHAVMQKIGSAPKVADLQVDESDDQISLRIVYPDGQQPDSVQQGRVDVALMIPAGLAVTIVAERGAVSGKTLDNPLRVQAVDQPVGFSSTGSIDVQTRNGEVAIQFKPRSKQSASDWGRIQTIAGDILISYYPSVEIGFDMVSGSSKTTDDPRLLQNRQYRQRHVLMRTSDVAPMLALQSDTGQMVISNNSDRLGEPQ